MLEWFLMLTAIGCCYGNEYWHYLEMNYDYGADTIHWPPLRPFSIVKSIEVPFEGYTVSNKEFCSNEHAGTHIDAPVHFAKGQWTVDQIPFEHLVDRPAVKIDISSRAELSPDVYVEVSDLIKWEEKHGRIAVGSVVLMYSGWGKRFWPRKEQYFGTKTINDTKSFHFPGFHSDAARWLIANRNIYGIGVDSASGDYGQSKGSFVHRLINLNNIYILENVANVDQLPEYGALITAMPIKIRGGTGGPTRIFARIPHAHAYLEGTAARMEFSLWAILLALFITVLY